MPRIALQLHPEFIAQLCQMVGVDEDTEILGHASYMTLEIVGPAEFNLKLMTDDEILEAAAADPELEIMKF